MAKKSLKELRDLKAKGLTLIDSSTGKPLDFAELEEKSKDDMYRMMLINDTHRLTQQLAETLIAVSAAQQTMIGILGAMQESLQDGMKKNAVKKSDIKISPKIEIPKLESPEIKIEAGAEPVEWEHEVVETIGNTSNAKRVISKPIMKGQGR